MAKMLHGHSSTEKEGNHYWNWIENYVADDYVQAVKTGSGMTLRLFGGQHLDRSLPKIIC